MDVTVALRPKSGELRPQHNHPNTTTRENVLEYDPDDYTLVNIRTETVQYGKHNGQAAALIVLKFAVKFRPGNKRLRSFNVNIEFGPAGPAGAGASPSTPKIARLAPEERRGKIFTEERNATLSAGLHVASGVVPGLGGQVEGSHAWKADREHEMRLSGWKKSSESATDNVAVWDCVEARKLAKGVLPGYLGAIVVQHHEGTRFQATFKLDVQRGLWNAISKSFEWLNLFGKNVDDPLVFDPAQPVGAQVDVADFKDVNLDHLVKLEPIPALPSGYN